jgi:hypothetical protein
MSVKYFGRNFKTGEFIQSDEEVKNTYLRATTDLTEHYSVKTISGKLSNVLNNNIRVGNSVSKYTAISEKAFRMFLRYMETGNDRFLSQAEQLM